MGFGFSDITKVTKEFGRVAKQLERGKGLFGQGEDISDFFSSLKPETPEFPTIGGGNRRKRLRDHSRTVQAIQRRILKSVAAPGRRATIATSPRGVQNNGV